MWLPLPPLVLLLIAQLACGLSFQPDFSSTIWHAGGKTYWTNTHLQPQAFTYQPTMPTPAGFKSKRALDAGTSSMPCTVVSTNETHITGALLNQTIALYAATDDIWTASGFLSCLLLEYTPSSSTSPSKDKAAVDTVSVGQFLEQHEVGLLVASACNASTVASKNTTVLEVEKSSGVGDLTPGPYLATLVDGSISMHKAEAIFPDTQEAFMRGTVAVSKDSHLGIQIGVPGYQETFFRAPSRLAAPAGPLSGLRFVVKDIYAVKGIRTSGGSRSYYHTYGPSNYTASVVQKLLDGGATLVGMTKTIAFALGAPRSGDQVDYNNPWSPRGDGYQTTGGSSSGSGAAVASYDAIDFALGTDTGGSVRLPAKLGGFYGYKPTYGLLSTHGILVAIAAQDTPGHMTRSPTLFTSIGRFWIADSPTLRPTTSGLFPGVMRIFGDSFPLAQPEAQNKTAEWLDAVQAALGFEVRETVSIRGRWNDTSGTGEGLDAFMQHVYVDQNAHDLYEQIGHRLIKDFGARTGGQYPPADPPVTWYLAAGTNETIRVRHSQSVARRAFFASWYEQQILHNTSPSPSPATCGDSLVFLSHHTAPGYEKETYGGSVLNGIPDYFYNAAVANMAGIPEITIPIGQVAYQSEYSHVQEFQPLAVQVQAAAGCDAVLFDLVDRLREVGLVTETLTGRLTYPL